jgi:protein-disulfide isomerase
VAALGPRRIASIVAAVAFGAFGIGAAVNHRRIDDRKATLSWLLSTGHQIGGDSAAATTIVEFTDYECAICAEADAWMEPTIRAAKGSRLIVHHLPLEHIHDAAFDAAISAECAARQGRFADFHHWAFAHQKDIRARNWLGAAKAIGVPNLVDFTQCLHEPQVREGVRNDQQAAERLAIRGTPAFLVNGRVTYGIPPDSIFGAKR